MTDFLLLHGPGHGGWVWDGVVGAMEDALRRRTGLYHSMYVPGTVLAPDLPGHGARFGEDDPLDLTFEHCVQDLLRTVEDAGLRNPVIGVHSLSGLLALELARRLGDVKALVLVGAAVPDLFHNPVETLPLPTRVALGALRLYPNTPPESVRMVKEMALALLCNDIPFPDAARAVVGRLRPIPLRPWDALPDPEALEPACPVTYLVLGRDRFLWPGTQRAMAASLLSAHVVELDCGHEAPITHPQEVADALLAYA